MKKLYPEYWLVPQDDETNDLYIKLAAMGEAIKESGDDYKPKFVLLHNMIRDLYGFENKIFMFAIRKEDDKMCAIFFNKEPDGTSYQPKHDEELGIPYIEVEED